MSCLPDCSCSRIDQETDSVEEPIANDESSYQPLSEVSYLSEAIPLLPKDSAMIRYGADPSHYQLIAIIGKGLKEAATISLARHLPSGRHVTVRRTNLDLCSDDIAYIQNEILITRQLRHENILPYLCSFVVDNEVWAVMPLLSYGSSKDIVKSHFPLGLPEVAIAFILRDVLFALDYIHKRGFIHRSVKASHILISGNGRAVLTGLRYSCNVINNGRWQPSIHVFPHDSIANLNWLSPEILEQNLLGYNSKSDIYSLGITACELANGIVPFSDIPPTQMLLEKLQGYYPRPLDATCFNDGDSVYKFQTKYDGESSYRNRQFTEAFHAFTETCLQRDPSLRPHAFQLLHHACIKQCKKSTVTLIDMLAIVTPFTEIPEIPKDNKEAMVVTTLMGDLELKDNWNF